jgi:D-alanine-D-alanine ligase
MGQDYRIQLGIIFGGRSGEYEVSLVSAASVIAALTPEEFEIAVLGITREGRIAGIPELRTMLPAHLLDRVQLCDALEARAARMRLSASSKDCGPETRSSPEIIFPLLHGPYGEDGTIQGLLEILGVPYIGCGVLASAAGMDKDVMKRLFAEAGLPVLPYITLPTCDLEKDRDAIKRRIRTELGYPVFSKPANLGSSVGVCKVHAEAELEEALFFSAQFDRKILVEKGIEVRELECAVLGNDHAEASTVGEITPSREFYDYQAKYHDPNCRLEIPARLDDKSVEEIRLIALKAFRSIDGSGLARVDFFMERQTNQIWLNEINTMPGFTPISMYSKLWAAGGTTFPELVRRLVHFGLERYHDRMERRVSAL